MIEGVWRCKRLSRLSLSFMTAIRHVCSQRTLLYAANQLSMRLGEEQQAKGECRR